jgi:hypothetical protein
MKTVRFFSELVLCASPCGGGLPRRYGELKVKRKNPAYNFWGESCCALDRGKGGWGTCGLLVAEWN